MMKKWTDIKKEIPPVGKCVRVKSTYETTNRYEDLYYAVLCCNKSKSFGNGLSWSFNEEFMTDDPILGTWLSGFHNVNYWEKEIFEQIKDRFEIMDL